MWPRAFLLQLCVATGPSWPYLGRSMAHGLWRQDISAEQIALSGIVDSASADMLQAHPSGITDTLEAYGHKELRPHTLGGSTDIVQELVSCPE